MKDRSMSRSVDCLPKELLDSILADLRCADLASASLVNRGWQALAFSHLYRTVYLSLAAHMEHFSKRVASDDGLGPFSICANVKGLVLDQKYKVDREDEAITEEDLVQLKLVINRFTRLSHMSWRLSFVPEDPEIMRLFQTQCPSLESVHLWLEQDFDFYCSVHYASLLQFKGLTNLSITSEVPPYMFDEECCHPLSSQLMSCPNLVSITFDLYPTSGFYSPNRLIESLGSQFTFPHLRTLRFRGLVDPDWVAFFSSSDSALHPLRSFLTRHPGIENLGLGSYSKKKLPRNVDLNEMPYLFPAVKCFEGPAFLCGAIARSTLAGQLEGLLIANHAIWTQKDTISSADLSVGALPRLRRFGVLAEESMDYLQVEVLQKLVEAANALEDLEIRVGVEDPAKFLDLVGQAPNLRKLTIPQEILDDLQGDVGEELGWEQLVLKMALSNPRLRVVRNHNGSEGNTEWEIKRGDWGVVAVCVE